MAIRCRPFGPSRVVKKTLHGCARGSREIGFRYSIVSCYCCVVPARKSLSKSVTVSIQLIERRIYLIRGHKVMIDADLAELYEVTTKRFNQQVRRNLKRFAEDFMFQLTTEEAESLRSQFATSKTSQGALRSQFAISKTSQGGLKSQFATSSTEASDT